MAALYTHRRMLVNVTTATAFPIRIVHISLDSPPFHTSHHHSSSSHIFYLSFPIPISISHLNLPCSTAKLRFNSDRSTYVLYIVNWERQEFIIFHSVGRINVVSVEIARTDMYADFEKKNIWP